MTEEHAQELFAGKFRLLRLLGRGAMGEVWLADEVGPRNFRRQVAVKRLLSTEGISDYARESFIAEAQVIARLDHPNIVRLIELGESDERGLYLVLDYIDGAALDRILRKAGALSPAAVALVGREVARALDAVHSMTDETGRNLSVVHRDVSPANILVGRDGRVRLSDFGVARIHGLGGEKTETGIFKGKLPYMPPEQALGEPFDGRADLFSLGVTLFEALIGGRLRKAETQGQLIAKIATERVPLVHEIVPDAMPPLAQAIDAATAFRSSERFPTSGHLATTMNHVLHSMGPGAEESAFAELAERVALVAGASTAPTTKQPWSLALSGEVPAFGVSGSNPRAMHTTGSGGYALGVPPAPPSYSGSGPHSGSGAFAQHVPTGAGPRTMLQAPAHTHEVPPSVPPDRAASVTRIASITDAQRPKPSSRAWVVALSAAAVIGILAGAFWVLIGSRLTASTGGGASDMGAAQTPAANTGTTAVTPPKTTATPSSSSSAEPVAMTDPSSSASSATDPRDPGKTRPKNPGPGQRAPATSEPTDGAPGTLQVNVSPWGHVSVDGKSYGTTPIGAISLSPGTHTVTVTNPDLGASRSATVKIVSGKGSGVSFDLKKSQ